jgi:hypothetical protein
MIPLPFLQLCSRNLSQYVTRYMLIVLNLTCKIVLMSPSLFLTESFSLLFWLPRVGPTEAWLRIDWGRWCPYTPFPALSRESRSLVLSYQSERSLGTLESPRSPFELGFTSLKPLLLFRRVDSLTYIYSEIKATQKSLWGKIHLQISQHL